LQPNTDKGAQSGPFGRTEPTLPQVFGRYLLVQRLSRGGMGEIFLAKHGLAGFEKLAVIKKVLPHLAADQQFISRFVDEAQVAIKLQHVNVAQVFEVGRVGDEYFLAIEYVEGRDLRRTLSLLSQKKQRFPVDLALFVGRELANGLAYAHRRTDIGGGSLNLVHCDISPPNVLVSFEGETKVIDFGIAKSALRATASDPKMGFGKFGYMAPEQLIRGGTVDHRTDIYAAGVVLFELLTGQRLYEAGPEPDYRALARKVAKGDHKLPSELDPMLEIYDDLVATALQPQSDDRYQSAAEFRDAIQQALVAVNPTISTDALGGYMRELFNDEMTAQR
jgi:serine/threonine protein kinase